MRWRIHSHWDHEYGVHIMEKRVEAGKLKELLKWRIESRYYYFSIHICIHVTRFHVIIIHVFVDWIYNFISIVWIQEEKAEDT